MIGKDSINDPFKKRSYPNAQAIMPRDSQKEPGLQYVDNLCSVIRLHKSDSDEYGFFNYIEKWIIELSVKFYSEK